MTFHTQTYPELEQELPQSGQHIVAYQYDDRLVVYQAYKPAIAAWAVKNQRLGGPDFSYSRMSWIKPNFLWMMYRCGWATKENQESVLALHISRSTFEKVLAEAVHSSFKAVHYTSPEDWKKELLTKDVRLQWDPDHDPYGNKLQRRAIQLGLQGYTLKKFGQNDILLVEDITNYVLTQKQVLEVQGIQHLAVPAEKVYTIENNILRGKIGAA